MRRKPHSFLKRNMLAIIAIIVVIFIGLIWFNIMSKQKNMDNINEPEKGITTQEGTKAPSVKSTDKEISEPKENSKENPKDNIKEKNAEPEKTIPVPEKKDEYSIIIDKSDFTLYLLDKGKAFKQFPVAIGLNPGQKQKSGDMTTPTGDFSVEEIDDASYWKHDFGDGKGEIPGAYGPYFISLITGWDGIGIHGTHDPASIGHRVSEGCIRLNNSDLRILKNYVNAGTKVRIRE